MAFLRSWQKKLLDTFVKIQGSVYQGLRELNNGVFEILPEVPVNLRGKYLTESGVVKSVDGEDVEMSGESQRNLVSAGAGRRHGG